MANVMVPPEEITIKVNEVKAKYVDTSAINRSKLIDSVGNSSAGKTAAKDIGMKAIDVGRTVAIDAGKILIEKAAKKLSTPKSQVANVMISPKEITKKVNEVTAKYSHTSAINLNKLKDGSSVNRSTASNAIAIQDLVRRLNGSGLKVT